MAGRQYWTRELLVERLAALGEQLGRVPKGVDLREATDDTASYGTYVRTFGSLENALIEAGYGPGHGRRGRPTATTR